LHEYRAGPTPIGLKTFPSVLERKPAPVCVKKTRQIRNPAPRFDSIETEKPLD
jgi:hypothetical protein